MQSQKSKRKTKSTNNDAQTSTATIIKTGDPEVDAHSMPSTLGGETAEMVDKFRQLKLKEYNEVVKMCKDNSVPLSEDLLKKGNFYNIASNMYFKLCWNYQHFYVV